MKTTGIGDVILLTAVARDVVDHFPGGEVVVFASAENAALAHLVEGVEVVVIPPTAPWRAIPLLRRRRLDVLVDFGQWSRLEGVLAWGSGARYTVGFETSGQRRHYAYDTTVRHADDVPEMENYRRLIRTIGVDSRSDPRFAPTSGDGDGGREGGSDYVVFHLWPGGFRSELREWPLERWRELARRMADAGLRIVLTGGPADAERTEAFAASCGEDVRVESIAGRCSLPALVDVLADARFVVSVNTGVMHLAAAAGAPTIALNGPTSALRWGPVGPTVVNVNSDLPGCGYLNLGFEYDGQRTDCMQGISVERVVEAAFATAHA
jgi:ADP-heptose:LPS heptosyltransferase